MTAFWKPVVIDKFRKCFFNPALRCLVKLIRECAYSNGNLNTHRCKEDKFVFPIQTGRRHCSVDEPIKCDVIENIIFCEPFALLGDFNTFNDGVSGLLKGNMVWLVIPFSVLISWVFTSLEQVGESTENPFEGGANDVSISQMSRNVEIDLREILGETDLPPALMPQNNIIL